MIQRLSLHSEQKLLCNRPVPNYKYCLLYTSAFCHPFKESNLADLDKPAPAERLKAGGVYQLIGARS